MAKKEKDYTKIKGWGVDSDPKNDPTYPMRLRANDDHKGYSWKRPPQQSVNIEALHSNERPNITAVFGVSAPLSGLSGMLRRLAFRYSEGSFAHWIPLLIADRVNVVEGVVSDLAHGHVPNIFAEKGLRAEWKYNRKRTALRIVIAAFTAATIVGALTMQSHRTQMRREAVKHGKGKHKWLFGRG